MSRRERDTCPLTCSPLPLSICLPPAFIRLQSLSLLSFLRSQAATSPKKKEESVEYRKKKEEKNHQNPTNETVDEEHHNQQEQQGQEHGKKEGEGTPPPTCLAAVGRARQRRRANFMLRRTQNTLWGTPSLPLAFKADRWRSVPRSGREGKGGEGEVGEGRCCYRCCY